MEGWELVHPPVKLSSSHRWAIEALRRRYPAWDKFGSNQPVVDSGY